MEKEAETAVFWDIYRCPVPSADIAGGVGPAIERSLKGLGYSGPITITAVGILTRVPLDILQAVYNSGVSLTYDDTELAGVERAVRFWLYAQSDLGKRGNVMFLSTEPSFRSFLGVVQDTGHKVIQEFPCNKPSPGDPWTPLQSDAWQRFLASVGECTLSDYPGWHCTVHNFHGKAFEKLVSHLTEHHVTHRGDPDPVNTWPCLRNRRNKQPMRKCKKQRV